MGSEKQISNGAFTDRSLGGFTVWKSTLPNMTAWRSVGGGASYVSASIAKDYRFIGASKSKQAVRPCRRVRRATLALGRLSAYRSHVQIYEALGRSAEEQPAPRETKIARLGDSNGPRSFDARLSGS